MKDPQVVGALRSGEKVVATSDSHLHGSVGAFLWEALAWMNSDGRDRFVEAWADAVTIGKTVLVRTKRDDEIVYAKRPGRAGPTRFVRDRAPEPSSQVTVVLAREHDDTYHCLSAWIGRPSEPEPWDERATERSREFWAEHALIWGAEEVVPGTETTIRPW